MEPRHLAPKSKVTPSLLSWPFQSQRLASSQCGGQKSFWPEVEVYSWVSVFLRSFRQLWWEAAAAFCARPCPFMVREYLDPLMNRGFIVHGRCLLTGLGVWEQGKPHLRPLNPKGHSDIIKLSECPHDWTVPKLSDRICPRWACVPCRTSWHHSEVTLTWERKGKKRERRKENRRNGSFVSFQNV